MSTTIITKNSSTASSIPSASNLSQGELAVNITDKRLFTKNASDAIVEVGTNPSELTVSGKIKENVFSVTGTTPALSPSNGTIQTWTLSGNSTPTAGTWNAGESITLMVLDGTAFTITWTSLAVTWVGGNAPSLDTTKYTVIELWKVGSVIYGALVGAA